MTPGSPWDVRIAVLAVCLLSRSLLGQKYSGDGQDYGGHKQYEGSTSIPIGVGIDVFQSANNFTSDPHQQHSTSTPAMEGLKMDRIMSPTLGPFRPSPQVRFPDPSPPPVYGEAKTITPSQAYDNANTGLPDVLTPPYQYYDGKHDGASSGTDYSREPTLYNNRIPPPAVYHRGQHPPPSALSSLFRFGNGGKEEEIYLTYDAPEEEHSYQPLSPNYSSGPSNDPSSDKDSGSDIWGGASPKEKAWKTLVAALTTLVPIGLFLAALPPNYVTVQNVTTGRVGKNGRSIERNEGDPVEDDDGFESGEEVEEHYPVLGLMSKFGITALSDPECESRIFCEMSRLGRDSEGNSVQRVFWTVVNEVPDMLTEMVGLRKLFKAARTDSCRTFKCASPGNERGDRK